MSVPTGHSARVSFASGGEFIRATRADVAAYLAHRPTRIGALARLYVKAGVAIGLVFGAWAVLLVGAPRPLLAVPLVLLLGAGMFLTALCVQHDANHGAFFGRRRYDHLAGWVSDVVLGFSSYAWRIRHNVAHHTYTNVDGHDMDITQVPLLRLVPGQRRRPWHRLQYLYIWPLYALMALRLQTYGDVVVFVRRRIGPTPVHLPRAWDLAGLIAGKAIFVAWAIALPMLVYPWWEVLAVYIILLLGLSLSMVVVFQLAHCVEDAAHPTADELRAERPEWAVHELETTVNFCPGNRLLTWAVGGLNFQIEHHLFPRLPHTHYPAIAQIVRRNAARFGLPYTCQPSLYAALRSHVRHVRELSRLGVPLEIDMG
jgi:linoleoyl-CoA desaturase